MALDSTTNLSRAYGLALQGAALGFLMVLFASLSIRYSSLNFSFGFLPLIAIYVWPEQASETMSSVLLFVMGIFQDLVTGGPIALHAITYLFCYALLRRAYSNNRLTLRQHTVRFLLWVVIVAGLHGFFGFIAIKGETDLQSLGLQMLTVIVIFPFALAALSVFFRADGSLRGAFDA